MISSATKRKIKKLEERIAISQKEFSYVNQEKIELRAKLQRFEANERHLEMDLRADTRKAQDENEFLRNLLRDLVVSPDIIKAHANVAVRQREMMLREQKELRKQENVYWNRKGKTVIRDEALSGPQMPMDPKVGALKGY